MPSLKLGVEMHPLLISSWSRLGCGWPCKWLVNTSVTVRGVKTLDISQLTLTSPGALMQMKP